MSSKGTILVTGTNGGLGSAIVAKVINTPELASNFTGVYTVRKAATATKLQDILKKASASHKHEILDVDLSSLASIKSVAKNVNHKVSSGEWPPIRALILNAAYQDHTELNFTDDGFEITWQVNYLANLVFVLMVLQSMDKNDGRILIVGSWSHDSTDQRNATNGMTPYVDPKWHNIHPGAEALAKGKWSTPEDDPSWFSGYRRYGASKLCAVMLMVELGHRLSRDPQLSKITCVSVDPGAMASDLTRRGSLMLRKSIQWIVPLVAPIATSLSPNGSLRTTAKSAQDIINASFSLEVHPGQPLYLNGSEISQTAKEARDEEKRKALWVYGIQAGQVTRADTVLAEWE